MNWRGIAFNLKHAALQDKRVRQAMCYAIDRETITKTLGRGYQTVATGPIPPQSWAYNRDVNRYAHDPARATALLKEAGWAPGPDGVLAKDGVRLSFGTDVEIYENLPDIVVAIQGQLRKVGHRDQAPARSSSTPGWTASARGSSICRSPRGPAPPIPTT